MSKQKCWFCDRKVEKERIFLSKERIQGIFSDKGVFSEMEIRDKDVKDWIVCNICAGMIKILASETTQVKDVVKSGLGSMVLGVTSGVSGITDKVKKKDS
ncbi:MAG: hypothetical protein ACXAEU_21910 [Candidatus Hodarchaeales archaeon]|jgi:ribosomal protein L11 methylase PrmA